MTIPQSQLETWSNQGATATPIAAPRIQNFAMVGLENNIETLKGMWDYIPTVFWSRS